MLAEIYQRFFVSLPRICFQKQSVTRRDEEIKISDGNCPHVREYISQLQFKALQDFIQQSFELNLSSCSHLFMPKSEPQEARGGQNIATPLFIPDSG